MSQTNKDAVVSGMGLGLSIMTALIAKIYAAGGTSGDIHCLATPKGEDLLTQFAQMVVNVSQCVKNVFTLEIDHSLTREQLLEALGCDWVDPDFTEQNIPLPVSAKKETVAIELLHLGKNVSDETATQEARQRGYRRATPREVLILGAKYSDLQKQFPVVAAPTGRRVLYLDRCAVKRCLYVDCAEFDWRGDCRFAVLREQF